MHALIKLVGKSVMGIGIFAMMGAAHAADSNARTGYNVTQLNRVAGSLSTARMPTMPTIPVGNLSPDLGNGGGTGGGTTPGNPVTPSGKCADGGVRDSEYTIDNCMNDVFMCVNGSLQNGINAMFSEDLRNSIINGMGLCQAQVDKCVSDVRKNCANVYKNSGAVWVDFNSRKVQPEYYNFVLRKTGLTPNQAENTCLLLDRNTYGTSFAAVSNAGVVTTEYNNTVGAYNGALNNSLGKDNPMGVIINAADDTVDGARGHYARWDATTAECWVRVAAYNKGNQIRNSWLFGAAGNDEPAEVWKLAGDTFSCNKDLFGFSLMNKTSTAAVVGIGGGTIVGSAVGAGLGHGKRAFDCGIESQRKELSKQLRESGYLGTVNVWATLTTPIPATFNQLDMEQCHAIVDLYDDYVEQKALTEKCKDIDETAERKTVVTEFQITLAVVCQDLSNEACAEKYPQVKPCLQEVTPQAVIECMAKGLEDEAGAIQQKELTKINRQDAMENICNKLNETMQANMTQFNRLFAALPILKGEASTMAKNIGAGAAVGAGAGGIATAITAAIEHSNISCHVGDNLATVGLGKSYSIGSLKDFYVKWNLHLPDTVAPSVPVSDCDSWAAACKSFTTESQCKSAQVNYKPADASRATLIKAACTPWGSDCVTNSAVAISYGACESK